MNLSDLEEQSKNLAGQESGPPLHLWQPELSGDIDIVIKRNGDWYHEGSLFERKSLVKLFASILRREEDGEYYLVTPVEKWRIKVEDKPLLVVDVDFSNLLNGHQKITVTTNMEKVIELGVDYPLEVTIDKDSGTIEPTVLLDYGLSAKVSRTAFYRIADHAVEQAGNFSVLSNGVWFEIG